MNKLFKLMTILVILMIWISCNSGIKNSSSYVDLMKKQKLTVFSDVETIGEVFNTVSKGKVVWDAMTMPANDSEYRYRNIHKTSVLVSATWPVKYIIKTGYGKKYLQFVEEDVILAIQFAVKKDKSEFEIYRVSFNGEYQSNADTVVIVQQIGAEIALEKQRVATEKWDAAAPVREKIESEKKALEEEKERVEEEKQKLELDQQIEFIKKSYFSDFNDTFENVFKIISNELDSWEVKKFNNDAPEYKEKKLYLVEVTLPKPYYYNNTPAPGREEGWEWRTGSARYYDRVIISFYAGEDWTKIEGSNIKQGDVYKIKVGNNFLDPNTPYDLKMMNGLIDLIKKTYKDNKEGK